MSNLVELADEESDVETQEVCTESSQDVARFGTHLENIRTMKRELDFRGTLLGKTWSELSQLLGKYQSELVTKYDQIETMLGSDGRDQITKLERTIDSKTMEVETLKKTIHDLETRLLEKDGEIVHLRTDVHKLRNEVSIKDSLITKIQNQMAKESMEYSSEISSLKEMISSGEGFSLSPLESSVDILSGTTTTTASAKRRKKSTPTSLHQQMTVDSVRLPLDVPVALPMVSLPTSSQPLQLPNPSSRLWHSVKLPTTSTTSSSTPGTKPAASTSSQDDSQASSAVEPTDGVVMKSEPPDDVMSALESAGETSIAGGSETEQQRKMDERTPYGRECPLCGLYLPNIMELKQHYDKQHENRERRCFICSLGDSARRVKGGRWHELTHFRRGVMDCTACGLRFPTAANFNFHLAQHQSTDIKNPDCTLCGQVFSSAKALKVHTKTHEGVFHY